MGDWGLTLDQPGVYKQIGTTIEPMNGDQTSQHTFKNMLLLASESKVKTKAKFNVSIVIVYDSKGDNVD